MFGMSELQSVCTLVKCLPAPPSRLLIRERQTDVWHAAHQNACTGKQSLQYSSLSADCECKFVCTHHVCMCERPQRKQTKGEHSYSGDKIRADSWFCVSGECWIYLCVLHHVITRIPVTNLSSSTCQWLHFAVLACSLSHTSRPNGIAERRCVQIYEPARRSWDVLCHREINFNCSGTARRHYCLK